MRAPIGKVSMENNVDVANYITSGISPSKKSYDQMKGKIAAGTMFVSADPKPDAIPLDFMDQVYKNKKKNQIVSGVALLLVGGAAWRIGKSFGKIKSLNDITSDPGADIEVIEGTNGRKAIIF